MLNAFTHTKGAPEGSFKGVINNALDQYKTGAKLVNSDETYKPINQRLVSFFRAPVILATKDVKYITVEELFRRISQPEYYKDVTEGVRNGTRTKTQDLDYVIISSIMQGGKKAENITGSTGLVGIDLDNVQPAPLVEKLLLDTELDPVMVSVSTRGHGVRAVVAVDLSKAPMEEYHRAIGHYLVETYSLDPASYDATAARPTQAMFLSYDPHAYYNPKAEAAFDLERHPAPTDDADAGKAGSPNASTLMDPRGKAGIVGAFCRAYTMTEAIETFLPEQYTRAHEGRYTYRESKSGSPGLRVHEDNLHCYAFNESDPDKGMMLNAWDKVRRRLFGHLDEGCDASMQVTELPSQSAMADFVKGDELVRHELAADDFNGESSRSAAPDDADVIPFPVEAFPQKVQAIIDNAVEGLGFLSDYLGTAVLAVASGVIGNTYWLKVKEGWTVPVSLFAVLVGSKGVGKSPQMSYITAPVKKIEARLAKSYKRTLAKWASEQEIADMESKAKKLPKRKIPKPSRPRLELVDVTIEKDLQCQEENPRGLIHMPDELDGLLRCLGGRYNNGPDMQQLLTMWNGGELHAARMGREDSNVERSFKTLIGTTQPDVAASSFRDKESNGFLDRFLLTWPQGAKMPVFDPLSKGADKDLMREWETIVERLWEIEYNGEPRYISLSRDALLKYADWNNAIVQKCNQSLEARIRQTDDDALSGIHAKMNSYCLRLSLILELLDAACQGTGPVEVSEVSALSMERAIAFTEYYEKQSLFFRKAMHGTRSEQLTRARRELYAALPDMQQMTRSEVMKIAGELGQYSDKSVDRFLKDCRYFKRVGHGKYMKTVNN